MLRSLSLAAVGTLALFSTPRIVVADPITYNFTGTLNQPINGLKTISGSLTIDATPSVEPGASWVTENGSDVSLNVNLGGQVIRFVNSPQNPFMSVTFSADVVPTVDEQPKGTPEIEFSVVAGNSAGPTGSGAASSFGMTFYSLGVGTLPSNLASLPLSPGTSSLDLSIGSETGSGTIAAIEVTSAPEPSMLVVFAGLGAAALVQGHRRKWRMPEAQ